MNADPIKHKDVTDKVLACFFEVYKELGPGFLESVYERALAVVLGQAGLSVAVQQEVTVYFRGGPVGAFRTDLIVADKVVVELKAAKTVEPAHEAQLLNYLRATEYEVGLLLNFGPRPQFKRLAFSNDRKRALPETHAR